MSKRKTVHSGRCPYCGEIKELEKEHVLPRCILGSPLPRDAILIRTCRQCNKAKSIVDEQFRDYLATDVVGCHHPRAKSILQGELTRSQLRGGSVIAKQFLKQAKWQPVLSNGGLYLGHAYHADLEGDPVSKAVAYIVRGLLFHAWATIVPSEYVVVVRRIWPFEVPDILNKLNQLHLNGPHSVGSVFSCVYVIAAEDHLTSHWVLEFFGGVDFIVSVGLPNADAEQDGEQEQ